METANIECDQISNSDRIVSTTGRLMIKNKTVTRLEVSKTAFFSFSFFLFCVLFWLEIVLREREREKGQLARVSRFCQEKIKENASLHSAKQECGTDNLSSWTESWWIQTWNHLACLSAAKASKHLALGSTSGGSGFVTVGAAGVVCSWAASCCCCPALSEIPTKKAQHA